jgi:hypothetical protein
VPDAHVLQLLTARHPERVDDRSAWLVSEVAHGRFPVEAADTRAWLRDGRPDEATAREHVPTSVAP